MQANMEKNKEARKAKMAEMQKNVKLMMLK
jgi:hypothetical protein